MGSETIHVGRVRADVLAEQDSLDDIVSGLNDEQWYAPTPSKGWRVVEQIAHLAYFDDAAAVAITDPARFVELRGALQSALAGGDPEAADTLTLEPLRSLQPAGLLEAWRASRRLLADAAASVADDDRIEWYGPSMGSKSFLTARLMEAWAHGQDVADAVGVDRTATDRLTHIARLGFITRGWSYAVRGLAVPADQVRVELVAPSGAHWRFGPEDAAQSISGSAEAFCLVVTQRRHVDDTDLVVEGDAARDWMLQAQAFAGGPTEGPAAAGLPT